jgi:aryl-alcohol dehydrogenase (NADP+)
MQYRTLGASGLTVSAICLGGNSWGAAGRRAWGAFGPEESRAFFRRALDVGITFFDTADTYNQGVSETIVGSELLSLVPRHEVVISTKVGIPTGKGPNQGGIGRKYILASIDQQLTRLRTDHIDVYQLHRLDEVTPLEETMATLTDLVRAGKVRYIGGSTMPAWRFAEMCMLAETKGYARPIAMQNLYNLIQREEEREMIPACRRFGVGLIPYSPLARGFLAGNRTREGGATERAQKDAIARKEPYRDCDWTIVEAVSQIAAARGCKPIQVALAWLLSKTVMAAPIIGATQLDYLNDAAAATAITLSSEEIAALEAPYEWRS